MQCVFPLEASPRGNIRVLVASEGLGRERENGGRGWRREVKEEMTQHLRAPPHPPPSFFSVHPHQTLAEIMREEKHVVSASVASEERLLQHALLHSQHASFDFGTILAVQNQRKHEEISFARIGGGMEL
jgi:hypothetical protein